MVLSRKLMLCHIVLCLYFCQCDVNGINSIKLMYHTLPFDGCTMLYITNNSITTYSGTNVCMKFGND